MDMKATFVRTGHLHHTLYPPLYEKYCTGMYSIEELKHCVLARVYTPDARLLDVSD
jgi:hypothetical protein